MKSSLRRVEEEITSIKVGGAKLIGSKHLGASYSDKPPLEEFLDIRFSSVDKITIDGKEMNHLGDYINLILLDRVEADELLFRPNGGSMMSEHRNFWLSNVKVPNLIQCHVGVTMEIGELNMEPHLDYSEEHTNRGSVRIGVNREGHIGYFQLGTAHGIVAQRFNDFTSLTKEQLIEQAFYFTMCSTLSTWVGMQQSRLLY